jgi:hypothetical protein
VSTRDLILHNLRACGWSHLDESPSVAALLADGLICTKPPGVVRKYPGTSPEYGLTAKGRAYLDAKPA